MSRPTIGVSLGSGSARGFAHIGVLQVLLENDIPVDIVTGCSMGALVGGLYVSGADIYFLEKFARSFDILQYVDLKLKHGGFIRGAKIENLLKVLTKNISIEDANIPYACVACDIGNGELKTFTSGSLYKSIRASISIPGVFLPYEIDGRTYIDGGVIERVPILAAKQMGADRVLAVDVSYRGQEQKPPQNLVETMRVSLEIASLHICRQNEDKADVLLVPDVMEIDPFSSKQVDLAVQRGRQAAEERIEEIKEKLLG